MTELQLVSRDELERLVKYVKGVRYTHSGVAYGYSFGGLDVDEDDGDPMNRVHFDHICREALREKDWEPVSHHRMGRRMLILIDIDGGYYLRGHSRGMIDEREHATHFPDHISAVEEVCK